MAVLCFDAPAQAPAHQEPAHQEPAHQEPARQQPVTPAAGAGGEGGATAPATEPPQGAEVTPQGPGADAEPAAEREADEAPKPPRVGIAVEDVLVQTFCGRCHRRDEQNHMTRISYVRKSPEGWAETVKRMGRLHGLQLTADTARDIVKSLANSHGLARSEAERGLYESERRVHWSEEDQDQDFRRACAQCHPLGRVLLQQRDPEEWQLLRATHVAMFPLSRRQIGGGPPEEERRRGGPPPGVVPAGGRGGAGGAAAAAGGAGGDAAAMQRRRDSSEDVGDRVLQQLAKNQPLITPAWEAWTQNRREVPLAGAWTVTGHEAGRGDVSGTLTVTRTGADEYSTVWRLAWDDGTSAERSGKGLLYAGYSWRGRARDADGAEWREVLLLDDTWQQLRGRLFSGAYDELGADVTLHRDDGRPRIVALAHAAIEVPSSGHRIDAYTNSALPATLQPADFFAGEGVTITAVERIDARHAVLVVDVAAGTALGARTVAFGANPGTASVTLYDTVDYVSIRPLRGLARVGGARHPRQLERFEAFAVHRGKDQKPFTEDDVDLFQVRPKWALAEFAVRDDDDDVRYVGTIDAVTGLFTPNVDGPNPQRKWQANNVGDVFVTCELELDVPVRPEPPKPAARPPGGAPPEPPPGGAPPADAPAAGAAAPPPPAVAEPAADGAAAAPARERRTFRARSHLVVTVPLYARWQVLEWEDR